MIFNLALSLMAMLFGTDIFWTTLAVTAATLCFATLIGRLWGAALPIGLKGPARFYLAPVLGLASLTVIASLLGKVLPLGDSVLVPLIAASLLIFSVARERQINQAIGHALLVTAFGVICGLSVLVPLFVSGAFNVHTDAFTYLVQSDWLQEHAFQDLIPVGKMTPYTSQVFMYQEAKLRMGSSFLLALMQGLLDLKHSDDVYPGLVIAALASCCLAIGLPVARQLRPLHRGTRLGVLALPAFTVGGMVFGANYGFLPQTVGLACGTGLLFLVGSLLNWSTKRQRDTKDLVKAALPCVALFSGLAFAYTEITPFIVLAIAASALIQCLLRRRNSKAVLTFIAASGVMSLIVLNTEVLRAYTSLRAQSGAIVGSPVQWSLIGFVAHAFGLHGGAWDVFQWSMPDAPSRAYFLGLVALATLAALLLTAIRPIWRAITDSGLLPTVALLTLFAAGLLYFRYFVPSPFPIGTGQSWSQFKLADWAHPFTAVLIVLAIANLGSRVGTHFPGVVVALLALGSIVTAGGSEIRAQALMRSYPDVANLHHFYRALPRTVDRICPSARTIYLNLAGADQKIRQMAVLYLHGRKLESNWADDVYFSPLPANRSTSAPAPGDCIIEPAGREDWLSGGKIFGPFGIGVDIGQGRIAIASASGGYDRETDGSNWWYWIRRSIKFTLAPHAISDSANGVRLQFKYRSRTPQTLTLRMIRRDGSVEITQLRDKRSGRLLTFDQTVAIAPNDLQAIEIEGDGEATPLGNGDARLATWLIENVHVLPEYAKPNMQSSGSIPTTTASNVRGSH